MNTDDIGRLVYLVLLLAVVGGYFFASGRTSLGKTAQQGLIWAMIFVGVIAVAGLWDDLRYDLVPRQNVVAGSGRIEVPVSLDGHYHLSLQVNDATIPFIVDTGASDIVLSRRDARAAGIDTESLAYLGRAQTANGTVPLARVTLDSVALGDVVDRNVVASVNGGEMDGSLLGMSFLSRFGRIEIAQNRLILER